MKSRLRLTAIVAAASLVVTTPLIWMFERGKGTIETLGDALWWWVVTASTVGYGDLVPLTSPGRAVAVVTIVTGFFVFANLIALTAESVHAYVERRRLGTAAVEASGHILICEYTAVADELIRALSSHPKLAHREVVILSDLVSVNPYPQHGFVSGVPINPAALRRAGVERADYVFVFANLRFSDPDVKTLHIALRVADLNARARILVEMVDPRNDLLEHVPSRFAVAGSRDLIRSILRDRTVDVDTWLGDAADVV